MEKYKIGTIFELYQDDDQEYIIINNVEEEKNIYLLVAPVYGKDENIKADYSKIMLLNVDKETENIEIETNEKIIGKVVEETMKQSQIDENE